MKCESNISSFCRKTFPKVKAKHIWVDGKPKEVCDQCYWILKQRVKNPGKGGYPTHKKNVSKTS